MQHSFMFKKTCNVHILGLPILVLDLKDRALGFFIFIKIKFQTVQKPCV